MYKKRVVRQKYNFDTTKMVIEMDAFVYIILLMTVYEVDAV